MLAMLWAVLQFALPTAATYTDARLARDGLGDPIAHVESSTGDSCRPQHSDECGLCHVATRIAAPASPPMLPAIAEVVRPSVPTAPMGETSRARARASLPRAPPHSMS